MIPLLVAALVLSCEVENPGDFSLADDGTSSFEVLSELGYPLVQIGTAPACSDGLDNDSDGDVDSMDSQCVDGEDGNERLSGSQSHADLVIPMDVDPDGTITLDPSESSFPAAELCFSSDECVQIVLEGVAGPQTASVVGSDVVVAFPMNVELTAAVGFSGLAAGCALDAGSGALTVTSGNYDTESGYTLAEYSAAIPEVTSCGSAYDDVLTEMISELSGAVRGLLLNDATGDPAEFS